MAENGAANSRVSTSTSPPSSSSSQQSSTTRPAITLSLPPRTSTENIFAGFSTTASGAFGASPGPLSLVSSFFSDYSPGIGSRSFSQLLAGAMSSPAAIGPFGGVSGSIASSVNKDWDIKKEVKGDVKGGEKTETVDLGFKQNRPMNLAVTRSPLFTIPPGLSPSGFLNSPGLFSPGLFSPGQDLFAMSHQEALAQVTAQAALSQSQMHMPSGYHPSSLTAPAELLKNNPSSTTNEIKDQHMSLVGYDPKNANIESPEIPSSDNKPHTLYQALDKPVDDGYHWRKYGQKQVKGGEYPRSYYKCSHHTCPVKKKVERSIEGQISEITYKGQHNHELPPPSKRAKDGGDVNVNSQSKSKGSISAGVESSNKSNVTTFAQPAIMREQVVSQATLAQESSDIDEIVSHETRKNTGNSSIEPNPKRRNIEVGAAKVAASHKTVTEQRIIVQTRSEVDLLDDGFRWRKYGQKVVKGNPHPRWSYYKCTTEGCNVRKHVERASTDVKAVITTYEGKHTHDPPTGRNYNSNKTNTNQQQLKPHKVFTEVHDPFAGADFSSNHTNPVAVLQLKEEQIRV